MRTGSQDRESETRSYVRKLNTVHHRPPSNKCDMPNDRSSTGQLSTNYDDDRKFSLSASPNESPKSAHKPTMSPLQYEHQLTGAVIGRTVDTVTLSAVSNRACSCGSKPDGPGVMSRTSDCTPKCSPDDEIFQHTAPNNSATSAGYKTGEAKNNPGILSHQLSELTGRVGSLETSLKSDIRTILEILHQQQQMQMQIQMQMQHQQQQQQQHHHHQQNLEQHHQTQQMHSGKTPMSSYQPSESDFSFDMCAPVDPRDGKQQYQHQPSVPHRMHVHRSVSQPECTEDRSLFR